MQNTTNTPFRPLGTVVTGVGTVISAAAIDSVGACTPGRAGPYTVTVNGQQVRCFDKQTAADDGDPATPREQFLREWDAALRELMPPELVEEHNPEPPAGFVPDGAQTGTVAA
jgi:hypothetical protein